MTDNKVVTAEERIRAQRNLAIMFGPSVGFLLGVMLVFRIAQPLYHEAPEENPNTECVVIFEAQDMP